MRRSKLKYRAGCVLIAAATLGLAACGKQPHDEASAPERLTLPVPPSEDTARADDAHDRSDPGAPAYRAQDDDNSLDGRARTAFDDASTAVSDLATTARVKSALEGDESLRELMIRVETHRGRVVLEGEVPSVEQSEHIVQLAQAVDGVRAIDNRLRVSQG